MLILRHLLTILLALQIVNPMCQCGGEKHETASNLPETPTSSCCSSMGGVAETDDMNHSELSEDSGEKNHEDNQHICMCLKDPNFNQDNKVDLPDGPQLIDLPTLSIIELPDLLKHQRMMLTFVRFEKHPPGPEPDIRVLFSSFQI